jgi:hypothetical protein
VISTTNASALVANIVGGDGTSGAIGSVAVSGEAEAAKGRLEVARRLSRRVRESVQLPGPGADVATGFQVDETVPCDFGAGTSRTFGTLSDVDGTGTLTIIYSSCLIGSDTLDGQATLRIDTFDGIYLTDTTITYSRIADHPRTIVVSTHLIDEMASLLEDVVIIDHGRLLAHQPTEELQGRGVELTGPTAGVDELTQGMSVLSRRSLGPTTSVVLFGDFNGHLREHAAQLGVTLGPIPLQDLFVSLTSQELVP